jgi:thiol:disulfide interchange protein
MNSAGRLLVFLMLLVFGTAAASEVAAQQRPPESADQVLEAVTDKTNIYPHDADANKEIQAALTQAATEKKRVLLVFGANWCYDCHVLDRALHEGAAARLLKENYLLVHVDIGEADKNLDLTKTYHIPLEKGVPAVAIINADGKLVYSSGYGEFEAARRMMKKDLVAFLEYWKPGNH